MSQKYLLFCNSSVDVSSPLLDGVKFRFRFARVSFGESGSARRSSEERSDDVFVHVQVSRSLLDSWSLDRILTERILFQFAKAYLSKGMGFDLNVENEIQLVFDSISVPVRCPFNLELLEEPEAASFVIEA